MSKKNAPLIIAAAVCIIAVAAMIAALVAGKDPEDEKSSGGSVSAVQTAEFTPPEFDAAAQKGTPDVPDDLGYSEIDAQAYTFWVCGKVICENGSAEIYLTNPDSSSVWLKVRVLDGNDRVLGETGLIKQGEYVQSVSLENIPTDGADIKLKVMSYEPDTYYSMGAASLNTTITVK